MVSGGLLPSYDLSRQGIILDELEKYVAREPGDTGVSRMRGLTRRGEGGYQIEGSYPDDEVHLIVRSVSESTGKAPEVILEQFAEATVPGLLENSCCGAMPSA